MIGDLEVGGGLVAQWRASVLQAGGELGRLVAEFDWSTSPLGPMRNWPPSLRTAVGVCLTSRFPIVLWWGPELTLIYNDGYRAMLGSKHPHALGSPGKEVWPEIWELIGPMLAGVLAGKGATWSDDQLLLLDRNGYLEECYFTFSYSPIIDESGATGGVFCAVTETTDRIVGARRLTTLGTLAAQLVDAPSAEEACQRAMAVLVGNAEDVRFGQVHLRRPGGGFELVAGCGEADRWPIREVAETGTSALVSDPDGAGGPSAYVVPILEPGAPAASAVLVAGVSDRRPFDEGYRSFLDLSAGHIGTAIGGARALETQRRRAQALAELDAAKTTFFSNISHELRTPLTLIMAPVADALDDREQPLAGRQRERLELVARNANRLRRLVNGMLDFAKLEAGRLVPELVAVDLARATTEVAVNFSTAMERAGLTFTIDAPPLPRPVDVDRDMWDRIVLNLLSNALKYTMTGEVTLRLRDAGDHAEMLVSDTGVGIAAEELPDLFNRFHRVRGAQGRSHEGSGIGLALVSELLRLLGGSVSVESAPGAGSTFKVRLPYGREATRPEAQHDSSGPAAPFVEEALEWAGDTNTDADSNIDSGDGAAGSVPAGIGKLRPLLLVAEDNGDLREYLRSLLAGQYDLQLAANGADALALARRHRPDLLLADVMMPKLDGFGLLAAIRADPVLRDLPVVLLSARAGEEAGAEGFAAGADDYLVKPFSATDLLTRLRANLDRARARSRDAAWRAAIVRALDDGVFVSEQAGVVVEVNEAFGRITGWGQRDAPYSLPYPWWPSTAADPAAGGMLEALREGTYEVPMRHREGHTFWARISATSVADERGGDAMLVGSIRDITRERALQAHRGAAARLAAALTAPLDAAELLAATVHGFGEVFGGDTVIATVDRSAWPPRKAITAAGPAEWESLPERLRSDLLGACREAPRSPGVHPGLLVTAMPAGRTRGVTHVVWTQFPARRLVTPEEHVLADMLGEILSAGLDRALRESRHATAESNLRAAIDSHRFIGQAVGILMERHRLTAAAAFDSLRTASQRRNIKLRDIAEHVIATGLEPDADLRR